MQTEQIKGLKNGLYEVMWESGNSSLCAIGTLHNGDRWISSTNWTHKYPQGVSIVLDDEIMDDIQKIYPVKQSKPNIVKDIKIETIELKGDASCNGCMFYDIQQNSGSTRNCSLVLKALELEDCVDRNLIFKKGLTLSMK